MARTICMSQSVKGALMNWTKKDYREATKFITKEGGKKFTAYELKNELLKMYSEGILYIPYGDCDNFDPKKGCQGHEVT